MNTNNEITLEVCTCTEWVRENVLGGKLDSIADGSENDAAEHVIDELFASLAKAGYTAERAGASRSNYHGWNGCGLFRHNRSVWLLGRIQRFARIGPVGTFHNLTAEQENEIEAAINAAREESIARFAAAGRAQ